MMCLVAKVWLCSAKTPKIKKFSQSFAIYNHCGYAQTQKFELTEYVKVCLEPLETTLQNYFYGDGTHFCTL